MLNIERSFNVVNIHWRDKAEKQLQKLIELA